MVDNIRADSLQNWFNTLREPLAAATHVTQFFNPWEISGLKDDEIRNTKVLQWILDPKGSHGFGHLFLYTLIMYLNNDCKINFPETVTENYQVRTEVAYDNSRIDLEISDADFYLIIEVKINAAEGKDQLKRYVKVAKEKASGRPICVVFLTPTGRRPQTAGKYEKYVKPMSWKQISTLFSETLQPKLATTEITKKPQQHMIEQMLMLYFDYMKGLTGTEEQKKAAKILLSGLDIYTQAVLLYEKRTADIFRSELDVYEQAVLLYAKVIEPKIFEKLAAVFENELCWNLCDRPNKLEKFNSFEVYPPCLGQNIHFYIDKYSFERLQVPPVAALCGLGKSSLNIKVNLTKILQQQTSEETREAIKNEAINVGFNFIPNEQNAYSMQIKIDKDNLSKAWEENDYGAVFAPVKEVTDAIKKLVKFIREQTPSTIPNACPTPCTNSGVSHCANGKQEG